MKIKDGNRGIEATIEDDEVVIRLEVMDEIRYESSETHLPKAAARKLGRWLCKHAADTKTKKKSSRK